MSKRVLALIIPLLLFAATAVHAQSKPIDQQTDGNRSGSTVQPQGRTGPINTKSGGAPASSPQGDTPAGMQPAQKGSSQDQSGTSKN